MINKNIPSVDENYWLNSLDIKNLEPGNHTSVKVPNRQDIGVLNLGYLCKKRCIFYTGTFAKGEGEAIKNMLERGEGEVKRSVNIFSLPWGKKLAGEK